MTNTINVNGKRYVCKIWDAGNSVFDRYTVIFKAQRQCGRLYWPGFGASEHPFNPQGFWQYFELKDNPGNGKHFGKRIAFDDCPEDVRDAIIWYFS